MGNLKKIGVAILAVVVMTSLFLNYLFFQDKGSSDPLTQKRIAAIHQYLKFLGEGNFKALPAFFTPNAILSDAIKGLTTPEVYYNGLYGYLIDPKVTVYDVYLGIKDKNVLAAHFTMKIQNKDGTIENRGQIVDLFVFAPNSTQFAKLYIQNNTTNYEFTTH